MHVGETGHVFVERQHPVYPHVIDFLISCCEPVSRTEHVEQYRLDSASLSAASAEGTYSMDMIRNILLYLRQDERTGQSFLDLDKLAALEEWAASRDAEVDVTSYRRCLRDMPPAVDNPQRSATCALSVEHASAEVKEESGQEEGGVRPPLVKVKMEGKACGDAGHATGQQGSRVLTLRRPRCVTTAAAAAAREREVNAALRERPLVSLAARMDGWHPSPLPATIEQALVEESGSSKVHIVLQPRLRRFTEGPAHPLSAAKQSRTGDAAGAGGDEQLHYFVVSSDRRQLEEVVESDARQYLQPIMLHGVARWIISDVDRGLEEVQMDGESGRPATLRRLFGTGVCAVDHIPADGEGDVEQRDGGWRGRLPRKQVAPTAANSGTSSRLVYKTQVKPGQLRNLKDYLYRRFTIRADCFYDHLQDPSLHVENLRLASAVRLRPYQTASLERFQRGHKAHQGVVVLPCGAGKTLTGIGAAAILQKRTIVMCINNMSVFQWQREFLRWTNLTEGEVTVCTAKEKAMPGKVFITTYSMLVAKRGASAKGTAARESEEILEAVRSQTWGLLLLDEVHTAVARNFQKVLDQVKYKCVLGLSATLLREDDRIDNLRHLVGPKLYEANWLDLTRAGFLARAECAEVQCPMPASFYARYAAGLAGEETERVKRRRREAAAEQDSGEEAEDEGGGRRRPRRHRRHNAAPGGVNALARTTASCNPFKLWCTQALLEFHRNRSPPDKVIIFCDFLADVRFYAHHLHLPFMDQRTSESERTNLLRYFQFSDAVNAIILTRVGDVALDLPCASVIIQISGLGGSQRQEAQRLGRILRPKPPSLDNTCSYFYTLVSQGTHEVEKGYRRQRWLRDQGFACRVLRCEQVLAEFSKVGGQRCCVGPPQWWYQMPPPPSLPAKDAGRSGADSAEVVAHGGGWWAPFSREASARLHFYFSCGRAGCVLEGRAHLGSSTPRPPPEALGGMALGHEESWTVQFSSADAPHTFGTVVIGEAPLQSDDATAAVTAATLPSSANNSVLHATPAHGGDQSRVRRVTFGAFGQPPHDCLVEESPCLPFALAGLDATVDEDHHEVLEEE